MATLEELAEVDPGSEVDLNEVTAAASAARSAASEAATRLARARAALERVGELAARLRAEWKSLEPLEASYAELDALTDVINGRGQNSKKMTLRSYVLAARLEEVAVAASAQSNLAQEQNVSGPRAVFEQFHSLNARSALNDSEARALLAGELTRLSRASLGIGGSLRAWGLTPTETSSTAAPAANCKRSNRFPTIVRGMIDPRRDTHGYRHERSLPGRRLRSCDQPARLRAGRAAITPPPATADPAPA